MYPKDNATKVIKVSNILSNSCVTKITIKLLTSVSSPQNSPTPPPLSSLPPDTTHENLPSQFDHTAASLQT
jgi:hypothetical protein